MKRYRRTSIRWVALRIGIVALAILVGAIVANAQSDTSNDVFVMAPTTQAATICSAHGGVSVIRLELLDSANVLEEVATHERVHQADMAKDSTICHGPDGKPSMRAMLRTEVHAYCISDSIAVRHGVKATPRYLDTMVTLVHEFARWLPKEEVVYAWFDGCGRNRKREEHAP